MSEKITTADVVQMRERILLIEQQLQRIGSNSEPPREQRVVLQQAVATGFGLALGASIVVPVLAIVLIILMAFLGPLLSI